MCGIVRGIITQEQINKKREEKERRRRARERETDGQRPSKIKERKKASRATRELRGLVASYL
jgi:hypothetical protein